MERLTNPPDRVADEVDADVRIVLVGGADESRVRLAHEIRERDTAILVLLGDRECEAEIGADQLGSRRVPLVIRGGAAHLAGELLLLVRLEHRLAAELFYIEIQEVAVVRGRVHLSVTSGAIERRN